MQSAPVRWSIGNTRAEEEAVNVALLSQEATSILRIALHCGTLRGFGSGVVGRNLLAHLAEQGPQHRFLAWIPREWGPDHGLTPASVPSNVELRFTRPGLTQKMVLENWQIRRALKHWQADVLFSATDTSLPVCRIPHLLLVHQPNLAYGPAEKNFPMEVATRLRWRAMATYLRMGLGSVTMLTVQTLDMADRLSARFNFPRDRIALVPSAVEEIDPKPIADDGLDEAPPFVTYVASASPHKNFAVLAPMMAGLRDRCPGLQCRLTVGPDEVPELTRAIERLEAEDLFVFEGPVSRDRAIRLIQAAKVFVMPSKLESFGLSYYESLAEGTPVVAADRPFAREACGEAGSYADADSGKEFADRVADLVLDDAHRHARKEASRARFQEVSRPWDAIATQYLEILASLARQRKAV